jgi:hypothetical protein
MKYLVPLLLVAAGNAANAQDTIYYLKDAPIVVKLEEINPGKVKYKLWENLTGPSYIAVRRDISRIISADGKTLWINEKAWERARDMQIREERISTQRVRKSYKRNLVSAMPICFLMNGIGGGVAYERMNKAGNTGFRLPVYGTVNYPGVYFMPSLRIYPFGQRVFTPFVAPTIMLGSGERPIYKDSVSVYGKQVNYSIRETAPYIGFAIEVGVNIHLTRKMFLHIEGGGGVNYPDLAKPDKVDYAGIAKFALGFGYRF